MPNPSTRPSGPDKHDPATLAFQTQAVHCGNQADVGTGAIRTPIIMANSYALPEDPFTLDPDNPDLLVYTRESGANQLGLQTRLAVLEGGEDAVVLGSGVAALHAVFFTHLRAGDHVVVSDVTYGAVWRLFAELLPVKSGIEATFVDITDLDAVRAALRPTTRIIHTEVIANPTVKTADIAALADVAHAAGALLTVDSTCTPPPLFRPLEHGADLVVHSLTKYINGHGDAMGGAVIGPRELILPIKSEAMINVGAAISPFNAWLISRGSITLPLRLRQHLAGAQRVAEFLDSDPRVLHVAARVRPWGGAGWWSSRITASRACSGVARSPTTSSGSSSIPAWASALRQPLSRWALRREPRRPASAAIRRCPSRRRCSVACWTARSSSCPARRRGGGGSGSP